MPLHHARQLTTATLAGEKERSFKQQMLDSCEVQAAFVWITK